MSGQDVYKKVYEDAERKVAEAVEAIGEIGNGLKGVGADLGAKADMQRTPQLRIPGAMEMRQMGLGSVYEEILDDLTDDVKVTVVYDSAASDGTRRITVRKGDLLWSEKVLLMTRVSGDMTKTVVVEKEEPSRYGGTVKTQAREIRPAGANEGMPEAYTTIIPILAIRSIDVAWEVDLESLRERPRSDDAAFSFDAAPFPSFEKGDASDEEYDSFDDLFASGGDMTTCKVHASGKVAPVEFKNAFGLRAANKARSRQTYDSLPPTDDGYRTQLDPFANKTRVTVRGKLGAMQEYEGCYRVILTDAVVTKVKNKQLRSAMSDEPMDHLVLFVSKDFPMYRLGTTLDVFGPVYAYTTEKLDGHKQLGICARKIRPVPEA